MKNFLLKIIGSVIKSVVVLIILFFISISLHSGKFPPDLKLARDYISQLTQVKEKYAELTHRSENYLKQLPDANTIGTDELVRSANDNLEEAQAQAQFQFQAQLKSIKSQLNRIEDQNKLILSTLKK